VRNFLAALTRNPISLVGAAITTASALLILSLFVMEIIGFLGNPYIGILAYMVFPGIFALGLVLIPIGVYRERRRAREAAERGEVERGFAVVDLNRPQTRKAVLIVLVLTLANIVILAAATYKGVEVMDSTEFCGETCHTVMSPELTAYRGSPHSRVNCVECHIGPGADWFVKSKLSGAWQVVAVTFDLFPRPIPTPIHDLRPARETCEQCHWPEKFVGDKLEVKTHYENDEANTEMKSVLLLRVGGVEGRTSHGIHWHVDPDNQIRYRSDESRMNISEVELSLPDGTVKTFNLPGGSDADGTPGEDEGQWRVMDCVDCHNRPSHVYQMPDPAMDHAIQLGEIDRSLPYIRREGMKALKGTYAASLGEIYATNVFPNMKVEWGTYPNHIGHIDFPGCFRCHDDEHATEDGETISQDCFTCHTLLAMEEEDPEILQTLRP
jgi:nitrate/TMAO reductase-like tetraheme cytochrome c subunit